MVSPTAHTSDAVVKPKTSKLGSTISSSVDDDDAGNAANYEALNLIGSGAYGSVYR